MIFLGIEISKYGTFIAYLAQSSISVRGWVRAGGGGRSVDGLRSSVGLEIPGGRPRAVAAAAPAARPPGCCGCMPPVYGLETTEAAEASCGCCGSIWCAPSAASLLPPEVLAPFSAAPPPPLVIPSTPTAAAAAENSTSLSQPAAAEWCNAAEVVSPKVSWRTSQNRSQCLLFYHIKWIP